MTRKGVVSEWAAMPDGLPACATPEALDFIAHARTTATGRRELVADEIRALVILTVAMPRDLRWRWVDLAAHVGRNERTLRMMAKLPATIEAAARIQAETLLALVCATIRAGMAALAIRARGGDTAALKELGELAAILHIDVSEPDAIDDSAPTPAQAATREDERKALAALLRSRATGEG